MNRARSERSHLVVIEPYMGFLEHMTDAPSEHAAAAGLGLPLEELCDALGCRITLMGWHDWYRYETRHDSFARWMPFPATRPLSAEVPVFEDPFADHALIQRRAIPACDPDLRHPFECGLSPRAFGLLAESDPMMLAAHIVSAEVEALAADDPIDAILAPMFCAPTFVAQMSRATGAGLRGIPVGIVVTGTSATRQAENGEGHWTRPAVTRRQMETMALGLADLLLCFGPVGDAEARRGQPAGEIVEAPRRVPPSTLDRLAALRDGGAAGGAVQFFLDEPKQGASGTLATLDAVQALWRAGTPPARPVLCSGADMTFPPSLPRDFRGYWSGRGWVRTMVEAGCWSWTAAPPEELRSTLVRLYPSAFEFLPDVWTELARGRSVLLSEAAAEGLAPGMPLPREATIAAHGDLAGALRSIEAAGPAALERTRRTLCGAIIEAHRGRGREERLSATIAALRRLLDGAIPAAHLGPAAARLLDARIGAAPSSVAPAAPLPAPPRLAVAVACYEMGDLVEQTVRSVWASTRLPDEILLVDDGSRGAETLAAIERLEVEAHRRDLPLRIVRQDNRGLTGARNRALEETSADLISFIDGDDLIDPRFYALACETLAANPELGGVAAWAETFGENVPPGFWNAPQPELPFLLFENTVFVPCTWPVALLRELGGYDPRQRYNYEDWELPIRVLAAGRPIVTIPRYLQRYRVRQDSLLRTMSDTQHQVMRQVLFDRHRDVVERFGPELAALTEHRLMRSLAAGSQRDGAAPRRRLGAVFGRIFHRIAARIRIPGAQE